MRELRLTGTRARETDNPDWTLLTGADGRTRLLTTQSSEGLEPGLQWRCLTDALTDAMRGIPWLPAIATASHAYQMAIRHALDWHHLSSRLAATWC